MRNPFTKLAHSVKNFFKGMKKNVETFVPQKPVKKRYTRNRVHFPSWWTRLFGLPNPSKLPLNKRVVKMQGSFKAIRPLGMSRQDWNKLYQIPRGLK